MLDCIPRMCLPTYDHRRYGSHDVGVASSLTQAYRSIDESNLHQRIVQCPDPGQRAVIISKHTSLCTHAHPSRRLLGCLHESPLTLNELVDDL